MTLVAFSTDLKSVLFAGECVETVLGCTTEDLQSDASAWMRLVLPGDLPALYQAIDDVVSGRPAETYFRIAHGDATRWVRARFPVSRESEYTDCILGLFADVTKLKASQESTRTYEERLRLLNDSAPIGIFMSDAEGRVFHVNPRLEDIYGYSSDELMGLGFARVFSPAERENITKNWQRVAATSIDHDTERLIVDGRSQQRWIHVRSVPLVADNGCVSGPHRDRRGHYRAESD